ncbi:MAG: hypothetical protein JSU95_07815 [Betaproteobacteria bacterium]|nr:MAG: hypothetical protein JSU95_07815 [Betaproteobacteria bacterium]
MGAEAGAVGLGGVALLIVIAIALILAIIAIINFFRSRAQRTAALGTVVGTGGTPSTATGFSETWTTAPPTITTGTQATFVFTVTSMAALSGTVRAVQNRQYIINVQPSANISIDSIAPSLTGVPGGGATNASGTITVKITANSVPTPPGPDQPPTGVIVAKQINDTSPTGGVTSSFTVQ